MNLARMGQRSKAGWGAGGQFTERDGTRFGIDDG